MIELIIDGNKTIRSKEEVYRAFIDTPLYNAIKGGILSKPREHIEQWLRENYSFVDEKKYDYIADYIATKI